MDIHMTQIHDQSTFYKVLAKDLISAHDAVLIESPFMTIKRVSELMPVLNSLFRRGVQVVVNTKPFEELDGYLCQQSIAAIEELQSIGVRVLFTVGHHRKLVIIDDRITWEGSLNVLSQYDSCEIMRRIDSVDITIQTIRHLRLDRFYKVK